MQLIICTSLSKENGHIYFAHLLIITHQPVVYTLWAPRGFDPDYLPEAIAALLLSDLILKRQTSLDLIHLVQIKNKGTPKQIFMEV